MVINETMITKKKCIVDIGMCIGLLALLSYQRIGEDVHEWIGVLETILFGIHLVLNRKWILHITKGKYSWYRILQIVIFISILICFGIQIVSGIVLSKSLFTFIEIQGMTSLARKCHMVAAYWGFVLLSLHIGLHIPVLIMKLRKIPKTSQRLLYVILFMMNCYGIYAFLKRDIVWYMLQHIEFAYFDFRESLFVFFFDYSCIVLFLSSSMHLLVKVMKKYKWVILWIEEHIQERTK